MPIDDDDIRWLLSLVESENLVEIEVHEGETEVLVRHPLALGAAEGAATLLATAAQVPLPVEEPLPENYVPVVAPASGVFYPAPSPDSPRYVEIGQHVDHGDTVGLIEVMKLFNDVVSTVTGTVRQVIVHGEEQVEAGQVLMLVEADE